MLAADGRPGRAIAQTFAEHGGKVVILDLNGEGAARVAANTGDAVAVEIACNRARELGAKKTVPLPVSAPFHCSLMRPAAEKLRERLAGLPADLAGDPSAVAQEIVRFVSRSDVDEEIVRMRGHVEHWQSLAAPAGSSTRSS